jgi:DnaJ family protein C protein 19
LKSSLTTPIYTNNIQCRNYVTETKPKAKSAATLVLAFGAIAATAKAGQYTIQAYNEWKESQPPPDEKAEEETKTKTEGKEEGTAGEQTKEKKANTKTDGKRENIFAKIFNMNVGSKYYEGGFDDKMTKSEAALILGVRESSTPKRIKDAHRKLLILNHPDTGGSTYLAGKLNEAKELLLKGKQMR